MSEEQFAELRETTRQQILAAYNLPTELTDAWKANHAASAGPVGPDEEPQVMSVEDLERWPDEEPQRPPITLARSVQTCFGCPSQWDAWTDEGEYLYLRFRWGSGTVDNEEGETIADFDTDDKWAGIIDLDEFCARAGLQLTDDHQRA